MERRRLTVVQHPRAYVAFRVSLSHHLYTTPIAA
jgi:hypothetical protein